MQNFLSKLIKYSIYVLVFLLPLFWLPFSFEAFEFNKQYLLFFLVSIALFAWLAKMVFIDKEIKFRKTPLDIFVLAFLFVAILSAVFSVDKTSSILGFYGRFSDGLIGLLSLGVFYFLLTNNTQINPDGKANGRGLSINGIFKVFSWSIFFVILFSYFSIFGIWAKLNSAMEIFPRVMLQTIFNPASGSMEGLTIFLAATIVLFAGLLLSSRPQDSNCKLQNIFYSLLILASLGVLIIVDYSLAWVVLLVSFSLFLVFALMTRSFKEQVSRLLLPIFLIIIAATFLFFSISTVTIPKEQVLGQGISWQTALGAATENVKSGFLGSGIGTYFYDFAKFKPAEFNQTPFWQIIFDRPGSHFAEILGTMGFLGLLSYLVLIGMFLIISWFLLKAKLSTFQLALLMAFLALLIGQFVYYQNTVLAFTFWLVLGLGAVSRQGLIKEKTVSLKEMPELSLVFSTLVVVLGIVILGLYYFGASYYLADVNYQKGLTSSGQERTEKLEKAAELNPRLSQYRLALSRVFLFEAFQEAQKPLERQDEIKVQNMVARAIGEARIATDLQPNSAVNWKNLGVIYREIIGIAAGAAEWGIRSFEKALTLEPSNPIIYTELGKLHFALGEEQKAKDYFQKALEKKPYYADAIIQEAMLLERENILEEAITRLENLITREPWNIEAHFQLGRLYYNVGRADQAIEIFEAVTTWLPQHSNALYSLGVAYIAKGRAEQAIWAFERVLGLNPGNQDVIQKLELLKSPPEPEEQAEEDSEEEIENEGEDLGEETESESVPEFIPEALIDF